MVGVYKAILPDEGSYTEILRVVWWATDFFGVTPDEKEIPLKPPFPEGGIYFKNGAKVKISSVDREREFRLGEVLELTAKDLAEICLLVQLAAHEIMETTKQYMKSQGIQIYEKNKLEKPYSSNG